MQVKIYPFKMCNKHQNEDRKACLLTFTPVFQKLTHIQWVEVQSELLLRVSIFTWLLTLQLFKNSIDTEGKLRSNLHSLSVSELLEYGRKSWHLISQREYMVFYIYFVKLSVFKYSIKQQWIPWLRLSLEEKTMTTIFRIVLFYTRNPFNPKPNPTRRNDNLITSFCRNPIPITEVQGAYSNQYATNTFTVHLNCFLWNCIITIEIFKTSQNTSK